MKIPPKFAYQSLVAKKHAPTALFAGGLLGMIGSTVLACRATLKLESVLARTESDLKMAKMIDDPEYTEQDKQKDTTIIYVRAAVDVAKLFGPAVFLGAASVGMLTKSHNIQKDRIAGLTAAYALLDQGIREYRARVKDEIGEDKERELYYGTEDVEIINEKTGKTKIVKRANGDAPSMYARIFSELNRNWAKEAEYNLIFLRNQQNYANDLLKSRGHVFLNEVYAMLGFDHSSPGSVVGWVVGHEGDNFVDFGIWDGNNEAIDFVNGREASVMLDFNVDGIIYDKIDEAKAGSIKWQD